MLILPNLVMFFTEPTTALTRIIQIVLPLSFYGFALTFNKKPGVMFWWLFLFIFIDAFQIVLLHLFGESPIAVDMFLNVVTTNATEVNELLGNLIPAVLFWMPRKRVLKTFSIWQTVRKTESVNVW